MSAAIIIPARWDSSRFPGKPLHLIAGKPLIHWVWERCLQVRNADRVIVATDDMRILETAFDFGAEVAMTSSKHPSGTDRIAEVARKLKETVIVNVQGDEPAIDPKLVARLIAAIQNDKSLDVATAACTFPQDHPVEDPGAVKVVLNRNSDALYFSRAPIPCDRDGIGEPPPLLHLGVYAFRRKFLLQFVGWKQTPLEIAEKLEQLRALEHGASIRVLLTSDRTFGVDTTEDAARMETILEAETRGK